MKLLETLRKLFYPRASIGPVNLPLHGAAAGNPGAQLAHHMVMQEMAGTNRRGEPRGFRIAPTSRKNPRTHIKGPTTRVEFLARAEKRRAA